MLTALELANLTSLDSEAYLDGELLVNVLTYCLAKGSVEIEYGEGEDRVTRWVSPLRLNTIEEGSVADAIITRARAREDAWIWEIGRP